MMHYIIFTCIIPSIAVYIFVHRLSLSPQVMGLLHYFTKRLRDVIGNFHFNILQVLLAITFWFALVGSIDLHINQSSKWMFQSATVWGTVAGLIVIYFGEIGIKCMSNLRGQWDWNVRVKLNGLKKAESRQNQKQSAENDTRAINLTVSLGLFSLLHFLSFFGYITFSTFLSILHLAPIDGYQKMGNDRGNNFLFLHVLLASLAGLAFTATSMLLTRLPLTEKLGRILLQRVTHVRENWKRHTMRSSLELMTWLLVVFVGFHHQYYGFNPVLRGKYCRSVKDNGCDIYYDLNNESMRAMWAVVWALQLGTLTVFTLVLSGHYFYQQKLQYQQSAERKCTNSLSGSTISSCAVRENARKEGLVLFDGNWYNVGNFVPHHPGGAEVLRQYLGTDISFVFRVMHRNPNAIMKYRKPVRSATPEELNALKNRREKVCFEMMEDYKLNSCNSSLDILPEPEKFNLALFEKDVLKLYDFFVDSGYFKPSRFFVILNTLSLFSLLATSILFMKVFPQSWYITSGIFLGLFWHQSGYLMHDAEHHNLAGNEITNEILGWMYGTVCLGVNGTWWREEHREHHAFLNSYEDEDGFKDPQMREDIWIQNKKLIPFFGDQMIHFLTNFQHILFLPVIFLGGRLGIVIDSTLTERKFRPWTKLGNVFHILLHLAVLSQSSRPVGVAIVGFLWQAILALQLLGNHYVKPWNKLHVATEGNFFLWQVLATQDFACPKYARWFYGGLNFHYSHHLFPTLAREYFHLTTPHIRALCARNGLPFKEIAFIDCVAEMIQNFKQVKNEFAKHGRGSVAIMFT